MHTMAGECSSADCGSEYASCCYRRTKTIEPLYMEPGTVLVCILYGMYNCLNISSKEPGGCVLIRALEPIEGIETMKTFRCGR